MKEKVLILDFGAQYTQLIARRVRELEIYSEIIPYHALPAEPPADVKALILSGSPYSVKDDNALRPAFQSWVGKVPILGICYGAQLIADTFGGEVARSDKREYGKAALHITKQHPLLTGIPENSQIWMSHGDTILSLPKGFEVLADTDSIPIAAFASANGNSGKMICCVQFHPEVTHSLDGHLLLGNFLRSIAGITEHWTPEKFVDETVENLRKQTNGEEVLMALSGGVDSTVGALLIHKAIGDKLHCFFIDNGLLRKNEFKQVMDRYGEMGLKVHGIDASEQFYSALRGVTEPEEKRKAIGKAFIDVFEKEATFFPGVKWLGQGTIYPDVIESISVHGGPSATIKSHHNVGGLPDILQLKIVEPLRMLFKDEVRKVGHALGMPDDILGRHPFPGPGLGIRILGEVTPEKVRTLQEADDIYIRLLRQHGWYDKIWQSGAILLPVQSVGVMGDERSYENAIALRAVNSVDGMTAEWSRLPHELLAEISSEIINKVKGINRVVYDISTKPPATIEWE